MTHSDLHAFILTSKVVDQSILLFTGICSCGLDTRKQFFQQFARLAQRNLLVLGLADRIDTVVLRLALVVGRKTQLAQRGVYFSQLLVCPCKRTLNLGLFRRYRLVRLFADARVLKRALTTYDQRLRSPDNVLLTASRC